MTRIIILISFLLSTSLFAQNTSVWQPDHGDGTYSNPILHADYSDPDVCRAGDDFYMTTSSFNMVPGLPILHSRDLVHWKLINYALPTLLPEDHFSSVRHGGGVWAPSIRFHKGEFYIFYPDPDFGIYMIKTKNPAGQWSAPVLVKGGKGLIDPAPLWDSDGKAYLTYALAGSRAGIKSILLVSSMNSEGTKTLGDDMIVFDGHQGHPTVEGPKFYKRTGYYYIFAPAGGVSTGWQLVLRSKSPFGPYEHKMVMHQGETEINGPHQGAWVELKNGEHWFLHFQDKGTYGRIVHLQPMKWVNDWPVIGEDRNGDGIGEPVSRWRKPNVGKSTAPVFPPESDDFKGDKLGLQWQWPSNPQPYWHYMLAGKETLRLYAIPMPNEAKSLWDVPNILSQKFSAEAFTFTAKVRFQSRFDGEKAGLVIMGRDYAYIGLENKSGKLFATTATCLKADKGATEKPEKSIPFEGQEAYLRVQVRPDGLCTFSISSDGTNYQTLFEDFPSRQGMWIGAKIGLFCLSTKKTNDAGNLDVDWVRVEKNE